jgi:hydrogenase maturation protease
MNPVAILQMVALLGGELKRLIVVGCEPSPDDPEEAGMELSAPVRTAVDEAVRVVEELIANFPAVQRLASS